MLEGKSALFKARKSPLPGKGLFPQPRAQKRICAGKAKRVLIGGALLRGNTSQGDLSSEGIPFREALFKGVLLRGSILWGEHSLGGALLEGTLLRGSTPQEEFSSGLTSLKRKSSRGSFLKGSFLSSMSFPSSGRISEPDVFPLPYRAGSDTTIDTLTEKAVTHTHTVREEKYLFLDPS